MSTANEELLKKMRCKVCAEHHGKFPDADLDGWVCDECRRPMLWAKAILTSCGLRECTKALNDTNGNRIGDNE